MNYKLEQLLVERKELNKQIDQLRKELKKVPRFTANDLASGTIFCRKGLNASPIVIIRSPFGSGCKGADQRYHLGGRAGHPCCLWSDGGENGYTTKELLQRLNSGLGTPDCYQKIGQVGGLNTF